MLARIWTEADLLVAECLRRGVWDGPGAGRAGRRGVGGALRGAPGGRRAGVGAARRRSPTRSTRPPKLWAELEADEAARGLALTREPDLGFVWPIYRWARGEPLAKVLASGHSLDGDMPAGDFVRWARQVIDLLGQLAAVAEPGSRLARTAREAVGAVRRGVVAYSGTV